MSSSNYLRNIAIVGAGGNTGAAITRALLQTGKHTVTALTRIDSKSKLPDGVKAVNIDYNDPKSIVEALRGQDALVITIAGSAPSDTQDKLIRAAAEAGVAWILPNEWAPDTADEDMVRDIHVFAPKVAARNLIEELGKSSSVAVVTGFWYEFMLGRGGFSLKIPDRTGVMYDDGETKISTSTLPQVGRAVAAILSLPVTMEGGGEGSSLTSIKNKVVYVNSFTVNQKEMLESLLRVTGTEASDWTITYENAEERYAAGVAEMKEGKMMMGMMKAMGVRPFYKGGPGDFESRKGTLNAALALPKDDLDEATKVAVEQSKMPAFGSH